MSNKMSALILTGFLGFAAVGNALADLNDGLVAYYPFDGNAEDASGNGNHGNAYGDTQYSNGTVGQAVKFDGQGDYIHIPQSDSLGQLKNFTIVYWSKYYKPVSGSGNVSVTITNGPDGAYGDGFFNYATTKGLRHYLGRWADAVGVSVPLDARIPLGQQEFIFSAFSANSHTISSYKNGEFLEERGREGRSAMGRPTSDWYLGQSGVGNYFLNGYIDELRIYNRVLSNAEIRQLYCQGERVYCEPLSVDISGFSGKFGAQSTVLTWTALSEHLGFNIYRAELQDGKYANVTKLNNDLYSNQGESDEYTFIDNTVVTGKTYYYGLESFDFAGEVTQHKDDIISITTE